VRHDEAGFHVAIDAGANGRDKLEIGWQRGERLRLANGNAVPLAEHVALQPVVPVDGGRSRAARRRDRRWAAS
jgi:hypothetical protein